MNLIKYVINHQYEAGGVVGTTEPTNDGWVSYETWHDHCPHSVTIAWSRRVSNNFQSIKRKKSVRNASV
jgi:hypothetical protein